MPPKYTPRAPQVGRYWPGKPLEDEPEESSSDEDSEEEEHEQETQEQSEEKVNTTSAAKLVTTMKTTKISEQGPYVADEEESSESEEEEEEEEPATRTTRIRQASRRAAGNFVAVDQVDLEEEEVLRSSGNLANFQSSEEESSEEEDSDEEEVLPKRPLMRPTFVSKYVRLQLTDSNSIRSQRDKAPTNGNNIGLANYGVGLGDAESARAEEARRKEEAIQFVENEQRQADQAAKEAAMNDSNRGMETIDDTDDIDPAAERAAWKVRELQRIKRDREALIARELEKEELEMVRNMDEEEREEQDYKRKKEKEEEKAKSRGQMQFMQKYYHKGGYYQDEEILDRNYNVATAEEHTSKEALPKSLQIRSGELGRAGRTKWTHLTAEDTSNKDSPWFDANNSVNKRSLGKMGGMHDPNDRQKKRRQS
jgi:microfibrillar-associated protein 1